MTRRPNKPWTTCVVCHGRVRLHWDEGGGCTHESGRSEETTGAFVDVGEVVGDFIVCE